MNINRLLIIAAKVVSILLILIVIVTSCRKKENPIKFPEGTFPDSTYALTDINSDFDDYNVSLGELEGSLSLVFSSNRASSGGEFDLEQGEISFLFDKTNGDFSLESSMTNDPFINKLIDSANTVTDNFGPYRLFSLSDGYEYLLLSTRNASGDLDFYYLKNLPASGPTIQAVTSPSPVTLFNTSADEAYICFDTNQDTIYFSSNIGGNYDIYLKKRTGDTTLANWFNRPYRTSVKVDSVNSPGDDKCAFISRRLMVFASNRPGGMGGYDLYYSLFKRGKWSSPINMGPKINTADNEFRPVVRLFPDFTNRLMVFSSDRPGDKGGYNLYARGITFND